MFVITSVLWAAFFSRAVSATDDFELDDLVGTVLEVRLQFSVAFIVT